MLPAGLLAFVDAVRPRGEPGSGAGEPHAMSGEQQATTPLDGVRVLTLAVNVPGPAAAARLRAMGAAVLKVEPPGGDPLAAACPAWYEELRAGQTVRRLDLKEPSGRAALMELLAESDLLLTSMRRPALARLGLDWPSLHAAFSRLSQVAIAGYAAPRDDEPGHDLTYLADEGLLAPPALPRTLLADLAGAERAVSAALALLLARERGSNAGYAEVSLAAVAAGFAAPLRHGLTAPGGALGGGAPSYNLYAAADGWVAVAALEPHFLRRLEGELGLTDATMTMLAGIFRTRSTGEWERWAVARDLPLRAVRADKKYEEA